MELYAKVSYTLSRQLTLDYSTSFGKSSGLFSKEIQPHIYAIYGLVRIADEIVDTYKGADQAELLNELEQETYRTLKTGYSTNPIVHAFALTANRYGIEDDLIAPFFESMRLDLTPQTYTPELYKQYIHGSAEVIGLMCLRVFVDDLARYKKLQKGAESLGAAYQKVNFLRDIASDYRERQRVYFPGVTFDTFDEHAKQMIISDIRNNFAAAAPSVKELPVSARKAVALSFKYYHELLKVLERTPVEVLKSTRVRVPNSKKLQLFVGQTLKVSR